MMQFIKNKKFVILAGMGIIIAAVLIRGCVSRGGSGEVPPKVGAIVDAVYALGTVRSESIYNLRLGVMDGISSLHVTEGVHVKQGTPLLTTEFGVVFRAPFTGVVSKLNYEKGETVMPGLPVLTLLDPDKTYILISLDQASALKVKKNQAVELSFEGMRDRKLTGFVERIYSSSGQFLARIYTKEMPPSIMPDMTVDVAILIGKKDKALLVPTRAARNGSITVVRAGKKMTLQCKTGIVNEGWTEVMDGCVKLDDRIVTGD